MKQKTHGALLALLLVATGASACDCAGTPYKRIAVAHATINAVARFVETFDRAVAGWMRSKAAECKAKHGAKTPGYAECVKPALAFAETWTGEKRDGTKTGRGVLPTIQSTQRAARLALDAAFDYVKAHEQACGKKDPPDKACSEKLEAWRAVIKPGVCGLWVIVDRAVKLGAYKATADPTYQMLAGLAGGLCK